MTNDLLPKNFWRMPMISFPSFLEDMEDMLPANNYFNGLNISEDDKNVYVEAAVPGIDPKEVDVTFANGVLIIKAEKKEEEKKKTFQRHAAKSFLYRVNPGDVDLKAEPQATCKNGVMTVAFAKALEAKTKKINVKTG